MATTTAPSRAPVPTVIACLALLLSGIAVGILVGRWSTTPAPGSQLAAQIDLTPILDELRRINRPTFDPAPTHESASPGGREAATPDSDEIARLTAAVQQLTEALQRSGPALGSNRSAVEGWKGPGFSTLDELFQRLEQDRVSGGGGWINAAITEMRKAHLGWTRDDLFERYGPPTSMGAGERGLSISYARETKPGVTESMLFVSADGLVTDFWPSVP